MPDIRLRFFPISLVTLNYFSPIELLHFNIYRNSLDVTIALTQRVA